MIDFFEAQERARRRTTLLVLLFAAAVVAIILVVYLAVQISLGSGTAALDTRLLLQVSLGVGLLVGLGSAFRTASLSSGGPAVAELLGARRLPPDSTDPAERRFLNVVEEMAIAAGTPVPAVYLLENEAGINAFAAGYSPHDAAVAVTQGALHTLTRDELQGVVAHEFSHILNGDMRLNIRLIGLLYGILLLSVVGRSVLRFSPRGGGRRNRGGGLAVLGLALLLVGYVGVFFGKLIKAAISRQREYLADSAAVEFTRNPAGLAGALKKIGGAPDGSRIANPHAEELSHLFFANGLKQSLSSALATHPPLEERIRRLDPAWSGNFELPAGVTGNELEDHVGIIGLHETAVGLPPADGPPGQESSLVSRVGAPGREDLERARALIGSLPPQLVEAAHSELDAVALVLALALEDAEPPGDSWSTVRALGDETLADRVRALRGSLRTVGPEARLPLLDLALPSLLSLSVDARQALLKTVQDLIVADGKVRLFEFTMLRTLGRRLTGPHRADRASVRSSSFSGLHRETEVLLSALAWTGSDWRAEEASRALAAGAALLPSDAGTPRLIDLADVSIEGIDRALTSFQHASPAVQRRLLEACAETATHDRRVTTSELELVRAIAESLDCPMPLGVGS